MKLTEEQVVFGVVHSSETIAAGEAVAEHDRSLALHRTYVIAPNGRAYAP